MSNYGQPVTFSTGSAPHLCAGTCKNFSIDDQFQRYMDDAEDGAILAAVEHSRKVDFSFDVTFDDSSTDFPDISGGNAAIVVSALNSATDDFGAPTGGTSLISRCVERWRVGQSKTGSIIGTYFPHVVQVSPALAATLSAFTPDQSALTGLHPASKIIWGTLGMTTGGGEIQGLTLTQELQLLPSDVSPAGTILHVATANYMRTIELEILALTSGTAPTNGATLTITGAPSHATGFRLDGVRFTREIRGRKMYSAKAFWFNGID